MILLLMPSSPGGQELIIRFLEAHPRMEFTRKQLQEQLGLSYSCVSRSIRSLVKHKEVSYRTTNTSYNAQEYYSAKCLH